MRRNAAWLVVLGLAAAACGNTVGVGLPDCADVRGPSPALILMAQAVPTAPYGPCVEEVKLGWDDAGYLAEDGRAGFAFSREGRTFLTAELTARCEIGDAKQATSAAEDIVRYEDIESVGSDVLVTVVPSSERAMIYARTLVADAVLAEIRGRSLVFAIDDDMTQPILARSNRAMLGGNIVLIVTDLDVEDETVELRTEDGANNRRLDLDDALEEIERLVPEMVYRGRWLFEFEGGCVTYHFDASGRLADGLANDAANAIGFYDLGTLRTIFGREGFPIEAPRDG